VVIPYTSVELDKPLEYVLYVQYKNGSCEFEIQDLLVERPIDEDLSEEEEDDDLDAQAEDDEESLTSAQEQARVDAKAMELGVDGVTAPHVFKIGEWEWSESTEELGLRGLYDEVR
jgi:hypothetical protein